VKIIQTTVSICVAACLPLAALAQEVELTLPASVDEDLRQVLENASLTLSLEAEEPPEGETYSSQDYVAAAIADYRRLLTGLYAQGFYGGTISIQVDGREASTIPPLNAPATVGRIDIQVTPGPEFLFGRAEVVPLAPGTELPEAFAIGEVARAEAIRGAVRAAVMQWRETGYAMAEAGAQEIVANHPTNTLNASVQVLPGPLLTFGDVTISGNEDVRTQRIREIAGLPVGTVFSPGELDRAQTRLQRTGAFRSAALVEADAVGPGDTLPIEVQVIERLPRRFGAGLEYSTIDGATVSAYWLHRNLFGGAERLRVEGEVSGIDEVGGQDDEDGVEGDGIDYRLGVTFGRPATFRPDVDLEVSATLQQLQEPEYFLQQLEADVSLTQYRTDRLTYGAGVGFLTAREETNERVREYTLLTLPLSGEYDRRDVPLDPTGGYYLDLEAVPFVGVAGDIGTGGRFLADARGYYGIGETDRLVFAARAQLGSVVGVDRIEAPADFLFYSGGGGTVRGQEYQSLGIDGDVDLGEGPVDFRTGGASFVGVQLEARFSVTDTIGVVGFYDYGRVGEDALPSSDDESHSGAGLGFRYDTGIGPIRLDVATPLDGDEAGKRVEVYIGIGQAF